MMDMMKIFKDKETMALIKEVMAKAQFIFKILPTFQIQEVTMEENEYIAVLFEHNEANIKRVNAIADLFEDILPPFAAVADFTITDAEKTAVYAALLFDVPAKKEVA